MLPGLPMHEVKDTQRALVRIGYDGRVHKTFRGPEAYVRFENEVRVLRYLEARGCGFVPRLLEVDDATLKITTTNCGSRVDQVNPDRLKALFAELESFGVRHDDPEIRNITYRKTDGRFCVIDFEFAAILDPTAAHQGPPPPTLRWSGQSHRGHVRPNNEDTFLALEFDSREARYLGKTGDASLAKTDFVFAVSDGMGGANSGEFASRITKDKITHLLPKGFRTAAPGPASGYERILRELFRAIHDDLIQLGESYEECRGMGTTLTLCWLTPGWMYFGHIGDSRLYHLPPAGEMVQLTHDHSHVGWLRRQGRLNERQARSHPMRNALNQSLGANHQFVEPHCGVLPCAPGDRFLLCTDGLIEGLWDRHLEEFTRAQDPVPVAQRLVAAALERAGRDNITALVVETLPGAGPGQTRTGDRQAGTAEPPASPP
jgi:PPM family protein phosphatase